MPFPISYSGQVDFIINKGTELTPQSLHSRIKEGLKKVKAKNIRTDTNSISFSGGIFRLVPNWNLLTAISSGVVRIESSSDKISVVYNLRFIEVFVIVTVMVFVFLGSFVWEFFPLPIAKRILLLCFFWFWFMGMNYLTVVWSFSSFIRKIGNFKD